MRLHDFILTNRENILLEWDKFADTFAPASNTMTAAALRDHAGEMLTLIAADLQTDQTDAERSEKSKGDAPSTTESEMTAPEEHGAGRERVQHPGGGGGVPCPSVECTPPVGAGR